MKTLNWALAVVVGSHFAGCGPLQHNYPKLAADPPRSRISPSSLKGEFTAEAHAQNDIAEMSVIFLKLRNDTESPRTISSSRIVGVMPDGRKISLMSPSDVQHQASSEAKANAGVNVAGGLVGGALLGGGIGAAAGAISGVPLGPPGVAAGAALGAAIGGGTGALVGVIAGALKSSQHESAEPSPQARIAARRLGDQVIERASQTDGYVFLPKDSYTRIELTVTSETDGEQELTVPVAQQH